MVYQVYGRSGAGENVTITARNVGGRLQLSVDGPEGGLNGVYYDAPANMIKSLEIRGSDDNETIIIDGPLGLIGDAATGKELTVFGRGGKDRIEIIGLDRPAPAADFYRKITINGGAVSEGNELFVNDWSSNSDNIYDVTGTSVTRRGRAPVDFVGISTLELWTGTEDNRVVFTGVPQALGLRVYAGPGSQDVAEVRGDYLDDPHLVGFEHLELHGGRLKLDTHPMTVDTFRQTGGTLDGAAKVTAGKLLSWTGGAMEGAGETVLLAGTEADPSSVTITGNLTLTDRTLRTGGVGVWDAEIGGGNATFINTGILNTAQGSLVGRFENGGTVHVGGPRRVGHVTVTGIFGQLESGWIEFDLGSVGDGHDTVTATEQSYVGGSLALVPWPGGGDQPPPLAHDFYTLFRHPRDAGGYYGLFANYAAEADFTLGGYRFRFKYATTERDAGVLPGIGLMPLASVRGWLWDDKNKDGLSAGEGAFVPADYAVPGPPHVYEPQVKLFDKATGAEAAAGAHDYDLTTGVYSFVDLEPREYIVRVFTPGLQYRSYTEWTYRNFAVTHVNAGSYMPEDLGDNDFHGGGIYEYGPPWNSAGVPGRSAIAEFEVDLRPLGDLDYENADAGFYLFD